MVCIKNTGVLNEKSAFRNGRRFYFQGYGFPWKMLHGVTVSLSLLASVLIFKSFYGDKVSL